MHNPNRWLLISLPLLLSGLAWSGNALCQDQPMGNGKIICWKDKSGKVVGCGDKVPPEYQDNATKELNKRGIIIRQSDASLTPEQIKARDEELMRKEEEKRKKEQQRRKDKALMDTFTTVGEIDDKRQRDILQLESNIETLQSNLKNSADRQADIRARTETYTKDGRPVPQGIQDEAQRIDEEKASLDRQVAQKNAEIAATHQRYDQLKRRFIELTTDIPVAPPAPAAPAPAPPLKK